MGSEPSGPAAWHLAHRAEERSFRAQVRAVLARLPAPTSVLDLGCGTAPLGPALLHAGHRYAGLDLSAAMLAGGARRLGPGRLVRAGADRLPFRAGSFGAVVALGLFEYLPRPGAALAEVARVLREGGAALVAVPRRESPYRRGLAAVAPLLRALGRPDPFDLVAGRVVTPARARRWGRRAGLRLVETARVAPAALPWPLDRLLPRLADRLAVWERAHGTAWLLVWRKTAPAGCLTGAAARSTMRP